MILPGMLRAPVTRVRPKALPPVQPQEVRREPRLGRWLADPRLALSLLRWAGMSVRWRARQEVCRKEARERKEPNIRGQPG